MINFVELVRDGFRRLAAEINDVRDSIPSVAVSESAMLYTFIDMHVRYNNVHHTISTGEVSEGIYNGSVIYRHISTATDQYGNPDEDAWYETFDQSNETLTNRIARRHD